MKTLSLPPFVHSVHLMEINIYTTLQIEVTVSQSDWHKVGSVNRRLTYRRLRNWRIKMCGKKKAVDRRSIRNIALIGDQ